jgi:Tfp pilus assembly protein PilX
MISRKKNISHPQRKGFTLIITISLLILLTMIAVGMLSLSSISLRNSRLTVAQQTARDNARMALMIAIGDLQKTTGSDMCITGTADLAGDIGGIQLANGKVPTNNLSINAENKGLTSVQNGSRYWTGVWQNSLLANNTPSLQIAQQAYSVTPSPRHIKWLVSGNENNSLLPSNTSVSVGNNGEVTNPEQAVVLVGRNTVGTSTPNALISQIAVPLVGINTSTKNNVTGRYGWWIGDEGVKTKFNLSGQNAPTLTNLTMVPNRRGWNSIAGFAEYPGADSGSSINLQKVITLGQGRLLADSIGVALRDSFHAATTDSFGLLSDNLQGGLRVDLSAYLNQNSFPAAVPAGVSIINFPTSSTNIIPSRAARTIRGPRWTRVLNFANRFKNLSGGKLRVTSSSATTDIIAPIIWDFRILMGVRSISTSDTAYRLNPCGKFAVTIANPYPYPLEWNAPLIFEIRNESPAGNRPSRIWDAAGQPAFIPMDVSEPAVFNNTYFSIPSGELAPGEARAFVNVGRVVRGLNSTAPVTVSMGDFGASGSGSFDSCVELEHNGNNTTNRTLDVRESWTTTLISLEMRTGESASSGSILRRVERFELDNGFFSQVRRPVTAAIAKQMTSPFPLMAYAFQISMPGEDYGAIIGNRLGTRSSTIRTFTDFNLQCQRFNKTITSYNPPPYFMESSNSLGSLPFIPPGGETGQAFTKNLAISPASWGRSMFGGNRKNILFGIPDNIVSLGQLQHADLTNDDTLSSIGHQPGNAVGNSYFSTYVKRNLTTQSRFDYTITGSPNQSGSTSTPRNYYDLSYLLNTSLWDTFFFSTTSTSNQNNQFTNHLVPINSQVNDSDLRDPLRASSQLFINGAFNVNCTNKDAWRAFLSSSKGIRLTADPAPHAESIFPRSAEQQERAQNPPTGNGPDSFAGYRRLNDAQIDALAEHITRQVRERGPFVSLGHFVNRALGQFARDTKKLTSSGAIQSAIDNAGLNIDFNGTRNIFTGVAAERDRVVMFAENGAPAADLAGSRGTVLSNAGSDPDWAATSRDLNPGACASIIADREMITNPANKNDQGFRSTGIPGWLTQADILQELGPLIAVRSDTFKIRSYGEALDPTTGKVIARAWCEAVVQRLPEYVDTSNPSTARDTALSPINRLFGRRFELVSMRWLNANEI